ncbi:hypothetical protein BDV93DRAFT_525276 [Ceratobasidium sp. AG-I]|nr:hypothetical protein BDV93DRAFT_525276 [Ceratobasidium sp. AG-I]
MVAKTLKFYSNQLLEDVAIMLVLEPLASPNLYQTEFPVAWKVLNFRSGLHDDASVRYEPRLGFAYVQLDQGHVNAAGWDVAHSAEITGITGGISRNFARPIVCKNHRESDAYISAGIVIGEGSTQQLEPTLVLTDVTPNARVSTQFNPRLLAFASQRYEAGQILRSEIETDPIWSCNLTELEDVTTWNLSEDVNGGYIIRSGF